MRYPFPGMNPYLESTAIWSSFHTRLLVAIADTLAPVLRPNYYIEVETRTYKTLDEVDDGEQDELLIGIPDAAVLSPSPDQENLSNQAPAGATLTQNCPQPITLPMPSTVKERYLEVREIGTEAVITVIEVLSPKNKRKGQGRAAYERKRSRMFDSLSHLIEIDLLRGYPPMTMLGDIQPSHYRIVVSRSQQRPKADLYGFNLQDAIPVIPLPLKPEDEEPVIELQIIVEGVCERAGYNDRIDYRQPAPPPALASTDQQWLDTLLAPLRGA